MSVLNASFPPPPHPLEICTIIVRSPGRDMRIVSPYIVANQVTEHMKVYIKHGIEYVLLEIQIGLGHILT